jgi:hypothetical protein
MALRLAANRLSVLPRTPDQPCSDRLVLTLGLFLFVVDPHGERNNLKNLRGMIYCGNESILTGLHFCFHQSPLNLLGLDAVLATADLTSPDSSLHRLGVSGSAHQRLSR